MDTIDTDDKQIASFDIIYVYLIPEVEHQLKQKFEKESNLTAILISACLKLSCWKPFHEENGIYFFYKIGIKNLTAKDGKL